MGRSAGCGFPWCGRRSGGGESARFARDAKCKRCKAFSAPSTPRGSRGRSRSGSPSLGRWGSIRGFGPRVKVVSTRSKYRDARRNINPRALPIVLHPDHQPRKTVPVRACQSSRRGCTDHRCHKHRAGWCIIS